MEVNIYVYVGINSLHKKEKRPCHASARDRSARLFHSYKTSHDRAPVHRSKKDSSKKGNQLSHLTSVSINL